MNTNMADLESAHQISISFFCLFYIFYLCHHIYRHECFSSLVANVNIYSNLLVGGEWYVARKVGRRLFEILLSIEVSS